jgi:hypothetical protein
MTHLLLLWPYAGLGLAVALLVALATERRTPQGPPWWSDPTFVLPLLWPMYLVHQFEEHGIDALGRHFAFLGDLCATLGHAHLAECPADAAFVFAVNCVACPMAFALPLFYRRSAPLVAAFGWSVPLVNAVAHIGGALVHRAYNPGLITSVALFAPLCFWMLRTMLRAGEITRREIPWLFACGAALHAVLIGSLVAHEHRYIGRSALLAINGLEGLLPLAFGHYVARRARRDLAAGW